MHLKNVTLAGQLRLAFLSVPVLLILTITIYSGFNLVWNRNQLKKSTAAQVAQNVLEKVDRNFYERFGDVQAYAANRLAIEMASTDSTSPVAQQFINTMISYYVLYDLMMILNTEGKVIACNTIDKDGNVLQSHPLIGKDFSTTDWFKACTADAGPEGGAWYSDFQANPEVAELYKSKGWGMAFAAPIKDDSSRTVGIWYNFASWKEVTQGIRQEALQSLHTSEPGSEILLLNEKGEVIDASDESLVLHQKIAADHLTDVPISIPAQTGTIHSADYVHGLSTSHGAYTYAGKNWRCLTFIPEANVSWSAFLTKELVGINVFFLLFAWVVSKRISNALVGNIHQLKAVIQRLSTGDLSHTGLQLKGNDELTDMGESVAKLVDGLKQTAAFAEEVGKGNFDTSFVPLSATDLLGNSLIQMNANLKAAAEEDRKRNWTAEGLARFADILRTNDNLTILSEKIISNLIKYIRANQGGLFMVNETGTEVQLELVACYAYDRKKFVQKTFSSGQGLLGQAYLEQATVYMTQIPENYIQITSGLGESRPTYLLIVPLKTHRKVEGVIEIASFSALQPHEIAFVEKVAENMATTIAGAKINERTKKLLESSQQQAEEMKAQEEEMRQNMEELIATQEEMRRAAGEYVEVIEELNGKINAKD